MPIWVESYIPVIQSASNLLASCGVLLTALVAVMGVKAWRREYVGRRRLEVGEHVLTLFYEAEEGIRAIRSPLGHTGEGKSRQRADYESKEEAKIRDQGYAVVERIQKHHEVFAKLHASKHKFKAVFRNKDADSAFKDINSVLIEIKVSADMLADEYWLRQGREHMSEQEHKKFLAEKWRHESIIWRMKEDEDEIQQRVERAIEKIEALVEREAQGALSKQRS